MDKAAVKEVLQKAYEFLSIPGNWWDGGLDAQRHQNCAVLAISRECYGRPYIRTAAEWTLAHDLPTYDTVPYEQFPAGRAHMAITTWNDSSSLEDVLLGFKRTIYSLENNGIA